MSTICLCMIVKNEKEVIERCLNSVKSILDYWVVVDTGSTDGTQEIIKNYLKDIPGELIQNEWVNFAHNRTESLNAAKEKADYVFWLDADEVVQIDSDFNKSQLTADSYEIHIEYPPLTYNRRSFLNIHLPWRFEGTIHNYPACEEAKSEGFLRTIRTFHYHDGYKTKNRTKPLKDVAILHKALAETPDSSRYTFYLAQTYRELGAYDLAIYFYKQRIAMGGWPEEVFYSMYQMAFCMEHKQESWDKVLDAYLKAYQYRPNRIEPLFHICSYYRQNKNPHLAYLFGKIAAKTEFPTDRLFIHSNMYRFDILDQFALCCYQLNKKQEALEIYQKLLQENRVPEKHLARIKKNMNFCSSPVKKEINLIGTFTNSSAAEWAVLDALNSLGYNVKHFNLSNYLEMPIFADIHLFTGDIINIPSEFINQLKGLRVCWSGSLLPNSDSDLDYLAKNKLLGLKTNIQDFDVVVLGNESAVPYMMQWNSNTIYSYPYGVSENREINGGELVQRKYDLGFVGYPTPRRQRIIADIKDAGISIHLPPEWESGQRIYGEEYYKFLSECKYILNVHASEKTNFETRVFEVLGSRSVLLSEPLSINMIEPDEHFIQVNIHNPATIKMAFVRNDLQEIADKGFDFVWQNHTMKQTVRRLFDNLSPFFEQDKVISSLPQKKKKIGFVTIWFERGQSYITRMMVKALEKEFEVFIFARSTNCWGKLVCPSKEEKWDYPNLVAYPSNKINTATLCDWIEVNQLDLVCFNEEYDFELVRAAKTKTKVATFLDFFREDWIEYLNIYDLIISPTKRSLELIQDKVNTKIVHIPWCFDNEGLKGYYDTTKIDHQYDFVANVGWSPHRKGLPITVAAFDQISKFDSTLTLAIFSQCNIEKTQISMWDGYDSSAQTIKIIKDNPNIYWIEGDLKDITEPYRRGKIYVYPFRLDGLGLTVMESLYCKTPVVATDYPPMNEYIHNNKDGILIRPDSFKKRSDNIIFPEVIVTIEDTMNAMLAALYIQRSKGFPFDGPCQSYENYKKELVRTFSETI